MRPAEVRLDVRTLTFAEVRDWQLWFTMIVETRPLHGELRELTLQLRHFDGEVSVQADRLLRRRERRGGGERVWQLDLQPGVTGVYRVTLQGSIPLDQAGAVPMPVVTVQEAVRPERWLALAGPDLNAEEVRGLEAVRDPGSVLSAAWAGREADRVRKAGGQAWKATPNAPWHLRLRPRQRPSAGPARVLLAEQSVALADGRRWLHESTFWLRQDGSDLTLNWKRKATVLSLTIDEQTLTPVQAEPNRLWLPPPTRSDVRCVRLRWQYDTDAESDGPILEGPQLEGVSPGPTVWTVLVPPGRSAALVEGLAAGPSPTAAVELERAEAQYQFCVALVEGRTERKEGGPAGKEGQEDDPALKAAQQRFFAACRRAERALALAGDEADGGTEVRSAAARLTRLKEDNKALAARGRFEPLRSDAEKEARQPSDDDSAMWQRGTPYLGRATPDGPQPRLTLAAPGGRPRPALLVVSAGWLGVAFGLWLLSLLPFVWPRCRRLWPELLAVLGALGLWAAGPTSLAALLVLLWLAVRLWQAFRAVRWLVTPAPAASVHG
jgi:hypothetical protein